MHNVCEFRFVGTSNKLTVNMNSKKKRFNLGFLEDGGGGGGLWG